MIGTNSPFFLRYHFKKSAPQLYDRMTSSSNQPGQLYGIAKTHKFSDLSEVSVNTLKFRPIISQVGTCTYNAAQVVGEYLKPLISENTMLLNSTQEFPDIIKDQPPLGPDEEYVSYDVESLFTNVPIHETIEYILDEIYVRKKLPILCKKRTNFKNFLLKLTCENSFMFNDAFYKQTNGCTMGGPLSVILSNIFMTMLEKDVVLPLKPLFYKRYVDDVISRRKKNVPDILLQKLNEYHPRIKFTVEVNPKMFLDTEILISGGVCQTRVYRKPNKLPLHWHSKTPVRYKRNAITGDLYRAKRISSVYQEEVTTIYNKFVTAGFPERFVASVIDNFNNSTIPDDNFLIPPYFFEEPTPFILVEIPYCPENERLAKHFITKFKSFIDAECTVVVKWVTRKIKTLFSLKSRNPHPSCKLYEGTCTCGGIYIGETKRNVEVRWQEHNDPRGSSEPAKHLFQNPTHSYSWRVLMNAPQNTRVRRNLEASFVALRRPSLNNQMETKKLTLFRYGVT